MTADLIYHAHTWGYDMSDQDKSGERPQATAPPTALASWLDKAAPGLLIALVLGVTGALLAGWRNEPLTAAEMGALRSEVASLRSDLAASERRIVTLEAADRQRAVELNQMQKTLDKIEAYNGKTMVEVQQINLQLAEMRGSKKR
jgi:hypothetical protein